MVLQYLLAEVVNNLQPLRHDKVRWKTECPQHPCPGPCRCGHIEMVQSSSCPSGSYHPLTAACSYLVGIFPFSLIGNTTRIPVWIFMPHEAASEIFQQNKNPCLLGGLCLRGKEDRQPWDMRLAIPHHPCDSGTAGEPPDNSLRSDCKLIPLMSLHSTPEVSSHSRAMLGMNSRKSRNTLGDLNLDGQV